MAINILDSYIFNKIAAGEVVEKPASIVKELVENSIDALSKNITIEIENGGIDFIKTIDDGIGIGKEDLEKVFLPHATSKISCVEDLAKIGTLGFRGEALASISAVSDVEIISKTSNGDGGKITCIDTVISKPIECGSSFGTTILVSDIFKNVPARRKFLRKPKSEENDITSFVEKLILANPTISIKYIANGKTIYHSSGKNLEEAIYVIYGKQVLDNLTIVNENFFNGIKLYGFISKPTFSKSNRNYQTLICNGRYIQNQQISLAISNAYSSYMMKGQFPFYVLSLTIPIEDIDVNVHPNKLEVRFLNKQQIFSVFFNAVEKTLLENRTKVNSNNFTPSNIKDISVDFTNEFLKNRSIENIEEILVKTKQSEYSKNNGQGSLTELFDKNKNLTNNSNETKINNNINSNLLDSNNKNEIDKLDSLSNKINKNISTNTDIENVKNIENLNMNTPYNNIFNNNEKPKKSEFDLKTDEGLILEYEKMLKKSLNLDSISSEVGISKIDEKNKMKYYQKNFQVSKTLKTKVFLT